MKAIAIKIGIVAVIAIILYFVINYFINKKVTVTQTQNLVTAAKTDFKTTGSLTTDTAGNKHYQTSAGQNTFTQETVNANPDVLKGTGEDSTAKIIKRQASEISQWQETNITITARALKAERTVDSLGRVIESYKDKWINISYSNGLFDYSENFNLIQAQYPSKKFLWINYDPVIDLYTDNQRATINGFKTLTIMPAKNNFGFRLFAKAEYDFKTKIITPSANATISIKNWDISGGYLYDYNDKYIGFHPTVSAAYNFINIK